MSSSVFRLEGRSKLKPAVQVLTSTPMAADPQQLLSELLMSFVMPLLVSQLPSANGMSATVEHPADPNRRQPRSDASHAMSWAVRAC
jgi:hypothetical protein